MKTIAMIFGAAMLIAGIAGFVPALCPDGKLLGLFAVNGVHNIVHIATGAIAIFCAMSSALAARRFFQIFGVVYGLVAALGFFTPEGALLGVIAHNRADMWLHVAVAAFSLFMGFGYRDTPMARSGPGLSGT